MRKKQYRRLIASTALILAAVIAATLWYVFSLRDTSREKTINIMRELSTQTTGIMRKEITKQMQSTRNLASLTLLLEEAAEMDREGLVGALSTYVESNGFVRIGLITPDGSAYTTDGKWLDLSDRDYFHSSMTGQACISDTLLDKAGGEEITVYSAPVMRGGELEYVLFCTYSTKRYVQAMPDQLFSGKGRGYIVGSDGALQMSSYATRDELGIYNLLDSFAQSERGNTEEVAEMRARMAAEESGFVSLWYGERQLVYFEPLGVNDWYMLTVVPEQVVSRETNSMLAWSYAFIFVCSGLIAALLLFNFRARKSEYEKLSHIAFVDELTGGATYWKFKRDAGEYLRRDRDAAHALVSLDIDHFRYINSVYGYAMGDAVLCRVWRELELLCGPGECAARRDNDHFVLLLRYREEIGEIFPRLEELFARIRRSAPDGTGELAVAVSAGVCPAEGGAQALEEQMECALIAQKRRKAGANGSGYVLYSETLKNELRAQERLRAHFEEALRSGEFEPFYQPKYDLRRRCFDGAEALARWRTAEGALIPPADFIPALEESGQIIALDRAIFDRVCADIRRFLDLGYDPGPISVNVSRRQLASPDFPEAYVASIRRYEIPASAVQLEITETMILENESRLSEVIARLHDKGIHVQLDDFGTGYSSIHLLGSYPIDVVKLDKSLADDLCTAERARVIAGKIIELAAALDIGVVAEGVESAGQAEILERAGCGYIQGYFYAKPMPVGDYENLLRAEREKRAEREE